jgi:hypothetical protein
LPLSVSTDIGNAREPLQQTERVQNSGVDTHSYGRVALLDALERRSSRKRAICDHRHSQLAATTRVMNVCAELSKRSAHSS